MIAGPILLTGAGGDIGIALACVLRETWPDTVLLGADCDGDAVGAEFVDRFHSLPRAGEADYLDALRRLIGSQGPQLVIPLAEAELGRLDAEGLLGSDIEGAALVTPNRRAVEAGLDKLATARRCHEEGVGRWLYRCHG